MASTSSSVLLILLVTTAAIAGVLAEDLAKGWGDNIDWHNLNSGLEQAKALDKPLMLIIHKSWCGACKKLKPKFAESEAIAELSDKFVMVNVMDDEEPKEEKYAPDGGYIPRILFLSPDGEVQGDIYNVGGNADYKYFYHATDGIISSMARVVERRGKWETKQEL